MRRISPRWFALASLLCYVSGPSRVLFAAAPIYVSESKHCKLASGSAILEHQRCRSRGSALTARVIAQLIEYQPPPSTDPRLQEEVISVVSKNGSGDGDVVPLLAILVIIASAVLFSVSTSESSEEAATAPSRPAGTPAAGTAPASAAAPPAAVTSAAHASASPSYVAPNRGDEIQRGQRVTMLGALASIGREGTILGPARGNTYAVQLDSGSIVHTAPQNFQSTAASEPASGERPAVTPAQSTSSSASAAPAKPKEQSQFMSGQRVSILRPPKTAGKLGTIMGPVGPNTFAVKLESGSIFHFAAENIEDAVTAAAATAAPASPTPAAGELAFTSGQHVTILAPPALAGKQGSIVRPAEDEDESYAVRMASGSIFNFPTKNIQGAASASTSTSSLLEEEEEQKFTFGQRVSILGPSKMAGITGSVVGPAGASSFAVQLSSGSIFHFSTENIQDATEAAAAAPPLSESPSAGELQFAPGQRVTLTQPPRMAGKQGSVVGSAEGNSTAVQLASGSIFNFATESLRDATPVQA